LPRLMAFGATHQKRQAGQLSGSGSALQTWGGISTGDRRGKRGGESKRPGPWNVYGNEVS